MMIVLLAAACFCVMMSGGVAAFIYFNDGANAWFKRTFGIGGEDETSPPPDEELSEEEKKAKEAADEALGTGGGTETADTSNTVASDNTTFAGYCPKPWEYNVSSDGKKCCRVKGGKCDGGAPFKWSGASATLNTRLREIYDANSSLDKSKSLGEAVKSGCGKYSIRVPSMVKTTSAGYKPGSVARYLLVDKNGNTKSTVCKPACAKVGSKFAVPYEDASACVQVNNLNGAAYVSTSKSKLTTREVNRDMDASPGAALADWLMPRAKYTWTQKGSQYEVQASDKGPQCLKFDSYGILTSKKSGKC